MTQIGILSGSYTDEGAQWRSSMPINKEPSIGDNGISKGFLGPVPGTTTWATGYGADRGAINWNGICYRVMGSKLLTVSENGAVTILGDVENNGLPVSLDYSFDRLAIASNGKLFYWLITGSLVQVTDIDLGVCLDVVFVDGRFMTTDGTYLVVTELSDPMAIDPLKYGSAETDPDPIRAICKIRGEVYALGQYTIQNFKDIGGSGFPFNNNPGGFIPRGVVGTKAWSYFLEAFIFVGNSRNERPSIYIGGSGQSKSISTQDIDDMLSELTPAQLSLIELEYRNDANEQRLYVHLPDKTLVYMAQASIAAGQPVWITLQEGVFLDQPYSIRHLVPCYGKWLIGSTGGNIGYLDEGSNQFWGQPTGWQFQTSFLYNEGMGAIVHRMELTGLPGRGVFGVQPWIYMSTTTDGETWGQEIRISGGKFGERAKRLVWWPNRRFSNFMGIRFRGEGDCHISFTRLEVGLEGLTA